MAGGSLVWRNSSPACLNCSSKSWSRSGVTPGTAAGAAGIAAGAGAAGPPRADPAQTIAAATSPTHRPLVTIVNSFARPVDRRPPGEAVTGQPRVVPGG